MPATVKGYDIKVRTTGSAGSATGTGTLNVPPSKLLGLGFNYHADAPATTDVDVTNGGRTLVTKTSTATDAIDDDTSGLPNTIVDGAIGVSVAQCDALSNAVVVRVYLEA